MTFIKKKNGHLVCHNFTFCFWCGKRIALRNISKLNLATKSRISIYSINIAKMAWFNEGNWNGFSKIFTKIEENIEKITHQKFLQNTQREILESMYTNSLDFSALKFSYKIVAYYYQIWLLPANVLFQFNQSICLKNQHTAQPCIPASMHIP